LKFDNIFDEYVSVRAKFDTVKKNIQKDDAAGGGNNM